MAIQTRGFGIDVMPQVQFADPRLFAFNPASIVQGANDTLSLANAYQRQKAFIQQQKELEALQPLRVEAQQAAYQQQIQQAGDLAALSPSSLKAKIAQNEALASVAPVAAARDIASAGSEISDLGDKEKNRKVVNQINDANLEFQKKDAEYKVKGQELSQQLDSSQKELQNMLANAQVDFYKQNPNAQAADLAANMLKNQQLVTKLSEYNKRGEELAKLEVERDAAQLKAEKALADTTAKAGVKPASNIVPPSMAFAKKQAEISAEIGLPMEVTSMLFEQPEGATIIAKMRNNADPSARYRLPLSKEEENIVDSLKKKAIKQVNSGVADDILSKFGIK